MLEEGRDCARAKGCPEATGGFCWRIEVAAREREMLERRGESRRKVEENSLVVVFWWIDEDGMMNSVIYGYANEKNKIL
jgi:hypothetical protein